MKRLLNRSEEQTNKVLRPLTEYWGAHTFPKVRVADILPIENSGIPSDLYRFALQSHFDFVVTDDDLQPLFAIEFDGDSHASETQRRRDAQKDILCERFEIPVLRINSRYINNHFRQMSLLSWFVNYWFAHRMIDDAYESGALPGHADVDPTLIFTLQDSQQRFPLCLTVDVRIAFQRYHDQGRCIDSGPSSFIGSDETGTYRAIAYLAVTDTVGLFAETAMRAQRFNVPCTEVVEAIAEHQIHEDFMRVMNAATSGVSLDTICERVRRYGAQYEMLSLSVGTQSDRLRAATPSLRSPE